MCGRFTLSVEPEELVEQFGIDQPHNLAARYNIAPSQLVAVIARKADPTKRGLALLKWGLVPDWSHDGKLGPINARAETVSRLPTFSESFREKRCIIPASGFYEWAMVGGRKVPHHFRLRSGKAMGFAGLWSRWDGESKKPLFTCCVITVPSNELLQPFHDRMPAILDPADYAKWFDPDTHSPDLKALLKPYPAELMAEHEANAKVNSPRNEGPELLDPAA